MVGVAIHHVKKCRIVHLAVLIRIAISHASVQLCARVRSRCAHNVGGFDACRTVVVIEWICRIAKISRMSPRAVVWAVVGIFVGDVLYLDLGARRG